MLSVLSIEVCKEQKKIVINNTEIRSIKEAVTGV